MKTLEQWCIENNEYEELRLYNNAKNEKKSNEVAYSGRDPVNWKCNKCGIEWKQPTNKMSRRANKGCPYCLHLRPSYFYNVCTEYPILEDEWYHEKNQKSPTEYLPNSSAKIWWKCKNGHIWQAVIKDRTNAIDRNLKSGRAICPYCNHEKVSNTYNLLTESPDIARQWCYLKNGNLTPTDVTPKSQKKVWWICDFNPNHIWQDTISNRTALNRKCKICSKEFTISFPSRSIYYYLSQCFPDCEIEYKISGKYILDICIPSSKIALEYDGLYFHSSKESKIREDKKDNFFKEFGFDVIRIKEQKHQDLDKLIKEVMILIGLKTKRKLIIDIDTKRDYQKIENLYYHVRKSNTIAVKCPELLNEWSSDNDRSPDTIKYTSNYYAKWVCPKCNRVYNASVYNRVIHKSNCPFCANRRVTEQNSLYHNHPDISKQWHNKKNNGLRPEDVTSGSDKMVWWKCEKGHEWQARVYSRTGKSKSNCPYCSHRKLAPENTLEIRCPELIKLWHYNKNEGKTPKDFSYGSNVTVWWKCEKGHEWQMKINAIRRLKSDIKCPQCRRIVRK